MLCAYRSVPASYRKLLPVEAFCRAAGVSPIRILEAITVVAVRQGAEPSAIIASIAHPGVVQKTVENALQDDGTEDRMMLHKAVRFPPTRRYTTTQYGPFLSFVVLGGPESFQC